MSRVQVIAQLRRLTPVLAAAVVWAAPLAAQAGARTSVVGRVVEESDTLRPVAFADVELVGTNDHRTTDANGLYRFDDVRLTEVDISVRRIGYEVMRQHAVLVTGIENHLDFHMSRIMQTLAEVTVAGRRLYVPPRFGEVYERAANGWGKFYTREDIKARNPKDVKTLLAGIPGVLINDRGITFQRCQSGIPSPFSAAAASVNRPSPMDDQQHAEQRPGNVQVFIDGVRMTRDNRITGGSKEFQAQTEADAAMELVPPSNIQAIEIYTGITRIPAIFTTDACAVIAIWTTSY